jgi:hypothetical protein
MLKEVSELCLAQGDGGVPTTVAAGSARGESGVFVFRGRFEGGMHISATSTRSRRDPHAAGRVTAA